MKHLVLALITAYVFSSTVIAQSKIEFGLTASFSKFMPEAKAVFQPPIGDVYGEGIGIYAQRTVYGKFSSDIGLLFHYKEFEISAINEDSYEGTGGYGNYGGYGYGGYGGYGYGYGGLGGYYDPGSSYNYSTGLSDVDTYPLRYMEVPIHLNYYFYKGLFLQGGAEVWWLINNKAVKERTEFYTSVGLGYQKTRFKISLNYLQAFKDSYLENESYGIVTVFRNRAVQLNLSYPLWQKM